MKKTIVILMMLLIVLFLSSCSSYNLEKAEEYMKQENYEKAEKIFAKAVDSKSQQDLEIAYLGLIKIYNKLDDVEALKETLGKAIKKGVNYNDEETYKKVFNYYEQKNDKETIREMINNTFASATLPDEIYMKYIIEDIKEKDMEIIKILSHDLNEDGKNEIIVTMGRKEEDQLDPNRYKRLKLLVLDNMGKTLYKDDGYESHSSGESEIDVLDFTGDGKPELYYRQAHYTNFISSNVKILDFKGKKVKDIYNREDTLDDLNCMRIDRNKTKIFSQNKRKSYIVWRAEDVDLFDIGEMRINFIGETIKKDSTGSKGILQSKYSVWDSWGPYGEVVVEHGYKNGKIGYKDLKFMPHKDKGVKIVNSKSGKDYDSKEYAKNQIIGFWDYELADEHSERFRIRVTENSIIEYFVDSEVVAENEYEVLDYNEDKGVIRLKILEGVYLYTIDKNTGNLKITHPNGTDSLWDKLDILYAQ